MRDENHKIIILASPEIEIKIKRKYEIYCADNEQELLSRLHMYAYDLIILENIMGCKRIHQCIWNIRELYNIPIIVFADMDDKKDLIYAGADIILSKNCNMEEIQIEIFALMRRWSSGQKKRYEPKNIRSGKLFFNVNICDAYWNMQKLGLSRLEFDFFYFLVMTPGRVYTYEQIYQTVWKQFPVGNVQNIIWCLVERIRRKLNKAELKAGKCIVNIRGIGYCYKTEWTAQGNI